MFYLGLDVHSKWTRIAGINPESGQVIDIPRMNNDEESIRECFKGLTGPLHGALEAGTNSWAIYHLLTPYFAELIVVDPASVWNRKSSRHAKTDRKDALLLAEKLCRGELQGLYIPDEHVQDLRCLVRFKVRASRLVTRLTNEIGSLVRSWGYVGSRSLLTKSGKRSLDDALLGPHSERILRLWRELQEKAEEIERELDGLIDQEAQSDEQCRILESIPGVGHFTSLLVRAEVGDISRFRTSNDLLSYSGLVPRVSQSADNIHYGNLVPWGNKWLKYALCLFGQRVSHSRRDSCFRRTYWRVMLRKGRCPAKIAVARQVCRQLHAMLRGGKMWEDPVNCETPKAA